MLLTGNSETEKVVIEKFNDALRIAHEQGIPWWVPIVVSVLAGGIVAFFTNYITKRVLETREAKSLASKRAASISIMAMEAVNLFRWSTQFLLQSSENIASHSILFRLPKNITFSLLGDFYDNQNVVFASFELQEIFAQVINQIEKINKYPEGSWEYEKDRRDIQTIFKRAVHYFESRYEDITKNISILLENMDEKPHNILFSKYEKAQNKANNHIKK